MECDEKEDRYSLLEMAHESSVCAEEAFRIGDFEEARRHYGVAARSSNRRQRKRIWIRSREVRLRCCIRMLRGR